MSERPLILVVDDDQPILILMRSLLREFGFEPVTASSGQQAVDEARRRTPALILLDRKMPGLTGEETIRELRSDPALATTPIVILSGEPMSAAQVRAFGANDAVLKPFDVAALVELVRKHLARE